jgi:hypothetical protein
MKTRNWILVVQKKKTQKKTKTKDFNFVKKKLKIGTKGLPLHKKLQINK